MFCVSCGCQLADSINFCTNCGKAVDHSYDDDQLCDKWPNPNRSYVVTFSGRNATLLDDSGVVIRRYSVPNNIASATTVTGETVTIVMVDGHTHLYDWTGRIIRRF